MNNSKFMEEFYSLPKERVILNKKQRSSLWKKSTERVENLDFNFLSKNCPALLHQIVKSYDSGKNIQAAVFSECVYAQTLANMLSLSTFVNCSISANSIPNDVQNLLKKHNLHPRYIYSSTDKKRLLIQAGGCGGIDCALINVDNLSICTIEFKEPGAKTSEPNLPKYGEDGCLQITDEFITQYPQFTEMLNEQKGLNFFEVMGRNVNNFSEESINIAVSNNYDKKYADFICTEDKHGILVLLPTKQVSLWASTIQGEIRPAGKNHCKAWTPIALQKFINQYNPIINDNMITIDKRQLAERRERGGNKKLSGYKITPLFFIYLEDCKINNNLITFNINDVEQLIPTIAGKMFFKHLLYSKIKAHYGL